MTKFRCHICLKDLKLYDNGTLSTVAHDHNTPPNIINTEIPDDRRVAFKNKNQKLLRT
ncbi:12869_t:CDS:2 [Gigaspora margarita]|uniref:12869_t:CDS:1 n=1 Tax=Gigaspora margarita TaxID=4874 RepID=A0ABN7UTE2_GIGMA|nr:12869_t:CDS:2 [Gigaspora margarita]